MKNFVETIDVKLGPQMEADLKEQGFEISRPPHTLFSAQKRGVSCTLYASGKLVVQGKEMAEFIEFYLEPTILKKLTFTNPEPVDQSSRIGSDETGKGDFFGPLCIAAVYGEGTKIQDLIDWGVKDSKSLNDDFVSKIAKKIESHCPHHIVIINPEKYNEIYPKFNNLNNLLAWGHATAISALVEETGCHKVIVDQFAREDVMKRAMEKKQGHLDLIQRHRAEEDVIVAAASILARATFLRRLKALGDQFGVKLPKGASQAVVEAGRAFVREHGEALLSKVCKMHFKTYNQVSRG